MRASRAWASARERMSRDSPLILMSICSAVTPSRVPATLKSMSPIASSIPWMSVRTAARVSPAPPVMRPIAMPPTGFLIGTPASISASVLPHTDPIDVDPLLSSTSDTRRSVYGNASSGGIIGSSARSASAPWPMSRRPGERSGRASPTLYGGKS